jgi:hypothetical protein
MQSSKRFPFNNQSDRVTQQYTLGSRNGLLARNLFVGRLSLWSDEGFWHFEISPMRRRAFNSKDWSNPVEAFNNQEPEKNRKSEGELDNSFSNLTMSLEIHCSLEFKLSEPIHSLLAFRRLAISFVVPLSL